MLQPVVEEKTLKGITASPGICIGKAYLVDKEGVDVIKKYYLKGKKIQGEINRFKTAVKKAEDEIRTLIENSPKELQQAHILENVLHDIQNGDVIRSDIEKRIHQVQMFEYFYR